MLEKMTLSKKITGGFFVILALLLIVGIVGFFALLRANNGFTQYRGWATDANLVGRVQANILMVRMNVKDYLQTSSQKDIDEFEEYVESTDGFLERADREIQNPDRAKLVDQVIENFNEYKENWDGVVENMQRRNDLVTNVLDMNGPILENTLSDLMEIAEQDNETKVGFEAAVAQKHLLLARLYMAKYLDVNDQSHVDRVHEEFGKMQDQLDLLDSQLQSTRYRRPLEEIIEKKRIYLDGFDGMVNAINTRNDHVNTLDRLGPIFAEDIEEVKLSVKADQDELGPKLQRANLISVIIIVLVALLSLITGLYASKVITGAITGPINKIVDIAKNIANVDMTALSGVVTKVADGDLSKDFKITSDKVDVIVDDEIGQLSNAFNNILDNFETVSESVGVLKTNINDLIDETKVLSGAAVEGKLDVRGDTDKFQGEYQNIVKGVNDTLDAVIGPLNVSAEYIDRISKGDIPEKITDDYNGDFNEIKNNLNMCIDAVNGLVAESRMLTKAATEGKLDVRGDADKFHGDYRDIVQGVNNTLDAVIGPLNVSAEYIDRISKGDIPEKITDDYNGDFNEIKNNLNMCIDAVNGLVAESRMLTKAALEGKLEVRGDADKFHGDYRDIVQGVNNTLDAVIGPLNVSAEYIDRISDGKIPEAITDEYKGDFNKIKNNLNKLIKMIGIVVEETDKIGDSIELGKLDSRTDTEKAQGRWSRILKLINDTIDALANPMQEAAQVMAKIADKDVTARVTGNYKGQLEEFKNDINLAAINLDEALQNVSSSVEQVASAADEVAKGSQQLAEGSNEQASSIEEVSSSLEEMSSMTQQNSDNSNQAKTLADSAHKAAVEGKGNMDQMSAAINKIKESSDETSKIVKTIDDIAFQTNLLALNAAVEAARAGEAGKGFAVVAEEVRNLAQRSAEAAKNTSQLIEESVENADSGVKITQIAAKGLESIVDSVKKTNDLIGEIAAASKEQATGIDQVSTAVQQMNKVTQENASNSEESASAAEEMSSQAASMQSLVGEFKLTKASGSGLVVPHKAPEVSKRKMTPEMPKKQSKIVKPDEVIPLDDEDFDDF